MQHEPELLPMELFKKPVEYFRDIKNLEALKYELGDLIKTSDNTAIPQTLMLYYIIDQIMICASLD